jgi:hypothetical protein
MQNCITKRDDPKLVTDPDPEWVAGLVKSLREKLNLSGPATPDHRLTVVRRLPFRLRPEHLDCAEHLLKRPIFHKPTELSEDEHEVACVELVGAILGLAIQTLLSQPVPGEVAVEYIDRFSVEFRRAWFAAGHSPESAEEGCRAAA